MRRNRKWLMVLGILGAAPSLSLAGLFSSPQAPQLAAAAPQAQRQPAAAEMKEYNQRITNNIQKALSRSKWKGCQINIKCKNGVAILDGSVETPQQRADAERIASDVKGVERVINRLQPPQAAGRPPLPRVQQAVAMQREGGPQQRMIQQVAQAEGPIIQGEPTYGAPAGPVHGHPLPHAAGAYMPGHGGGPLPAYGHPGAGAPHVVYDQPNLPEHAWPSMAAYPNAAAVSYPQQYSASCWPYIGPFYPYPQVPQGWRKVTLEWDDGFWNLNFNSRTDRWWWFLDYRNW